MFENPFISIRIIVEIVQNEQLLNDELYLGLRRPRFRGTEYDQFVDTFVHAAHELYPKAYLHL